LGSKLSFASGVAGGKEKRSILVRGLFVHTVGKGDLTVEERGHKKEKRSLMENSTISGRTTPTMQKPSGRGKTRGMPKLRDTRRKVSFTREKENLLTCLKRARISLEEGKGEEAHQRFVREDVSSSEKGDRKFKRGKNPNTM